MSNFKTLYFYEMKKLLSRKLVCVTFLIMVVFGVMCVVMPLAGNVYIDGVKVDTSAHSNKVDTEYARALNGRKLNQSLLEEVWEAYGKVPLSGNGHYTGTEEYQKYARQYSSVFNAVRDITGMRDINEFFEWSPNEEDMYVRRQAMLEEQWDAYYLTESEKAFWREKEAQLEKPFVLNYGDGYSMIAYNLINNIGSYGVLMMAICLSGIFTDETTRKTDQLILCSKNGRTKLYWVKVAAGASFAAGSTFIAVLITVGLDFAVYGADGFDTAVQISYKGTSYPLSIGQIVLIMIAMVFVGLIFTSLFVMLVSQLLRSSMGTLSLVVGIFILTLVLRVPSYYRVLSQLVDYLVPSLFMQLSSVFGTRLIPMGKLVFMPYQVVPVLYAVLGICFVFIGSAVYKQQQIEGR